MSAHGSHSSSEEHTHSALDLPYGLPDWAFQDMAHPDLDTSAGSSDVSVITKTVDENDNLELPTFGN